MGLLQVPRLGLVEKGDRGVLGQQLLGLGVELEAAGRVGLAAGLLDQAALYGVLAEIEALGLDLLEIRKLTPGRESPGSGHHRSP